MIVLQIGMAIGFSLFWMWWYYRQDVYEKEPVGLLAKLFLLSMPLSVLVGLFEWAIDGGTERRFSGSDNIFLIIIFYFFIVSVSEELAKFAVVFTLTRNHEAFNEQIDGIMYAVASALGFATFENIFFIGDQGDFIILLRGPVSALAHILFSAMWGIALGYARFQKSRRQQWRLVSRGLLRAILSHAVFDTLISFGTFFKIEWLAFGSVVFLGFMYFVVAAEIERALRVSDYNPTNQASRTLERLRRNDDDRRYVPNPNRQSSEVQSQKPEASSEDETAIENDEKSE